MKILRRVAVSMALLAATAGPALADEVTEVKFCGGPEGLSYIKIPNRTAKSVSSMGAKFTIKVVETEGGKDNVQKVANNKCDYGIAPVKLVKRTPKLKVVGRMFNTYAHLVCNRNKINGATEIADLLPKYQKGRKVSIAIGGMNSASRATWEELKNLDDDFTSENFTIIPLGFSDAIEQVRAGFIQCAWAVSGIGFDAMKSANYKGAVDELIMIPVNDSDFDNNDWDLVDISGDNYPHLLDSMFGTDDVETIEVPVVLFARDGFIKLNPLVHGLTVTAANAAAEELFEDK